MMLGLLLNSFAGLSQPFLAADNRQVFGQLDLVVSRLIRKVRVT